MKPQFQNTYLLLIRLWLSYMMITGGQSILHFFSAQEKEFFRNWFGNELGIPFPIVSAYLAKGTEFFGGIFIFLGLVTRFSAMMIAVVMTVATLVANIDYSLKEGILRQDATVTISSVLFAVILIYFGAGKYSVDFLLAQLRRKIVTTEHPI